MPCAQVEGGWDEVRLPGSREVWLGCMSGALWHVDGSGIGRGVLGRHHFDCRERRGTKSAANGCGTKVGSGLLS
jgi:hypothetical protein